MKEPIDPVKNLSKRYYFINYIDFKHLMMVSLGNEIEIRGSSLNFEHDILLHVDSIIKKNNIILLQVEIEKGNLSFKKDTIRYNSDLSEYHFRNMIFRHYDGKTKVPPTNFDEMENVNKRQSLDEYFKVEMIEIELGPVPRQIKKVKK